MLHRVAGVHLTISSYSDFMHKDLTGFFPHFLDTVVPKFLEHDCKGINVTCSGEPGCLCDGTKGVDEEHFAWFLLQKQGKGLQGYSPCVLSASVYPAKIFLFCLGALPLYLLGIKRVEECKAISILH